MQLDQAQLMALSGVWASLLFGGLLLATGPPLCMAQAVCQHVLFGVGGMDSWQRGARALSSPQELNAFLIMGLAMLFGGTLASAAGKEGEGMRMMNTFPRAVSTYSPLSQDPGGFKLCFGTLLGVSLQT